MGGFYFFKWRGRYYVYYNHWDSHPDGLGEILTSMVPSDPDAYQKWLEQKRAEYSDVDKKLETQVFAVSPKRALSGVYIPLAVTGAEGIEYIPSFVPPGEKMGIEWSYGFDLDREQFIVNDCCQFHLSNFDRGWPSLLEYAKEFYLSSMQNFQTFQGSRPLRNVAHKSITTSIVQSLKIEYDPILEYKQLNPTLVRPKTESALNSKPSFIVCNELFSALRAKKHVWHACYTQRKDDFLFREASFLFLCLSSCSSALVRLASKVRVDTVSASFATLNAIISTKDQTEFAASVFEGYHLEGKEHGSAPSSDSYWLLNVFVYLCRDLYCRENFHKAIVDAVKKGRAQGRKQFNSIVVSLTHVVLIRVTDDAVQHTRRLQFVEPFSLDINWGIRAITCFNEGKEYYSDENHKKKSDDDEGDDKEVPTSTSATSNSDYEALKVLEQEWAQTFDELQALTWKNKGSTLAAIAHLFEATATEALSPSNSLAHGIFPNEIYRMIVNHVDGATRQACLSVSRAFRDYATNTFSMTDDLTFVSFPGTARPQLYHPITGLLGPFELKKTDSMSTATELHPVIGKCDGTASFMSEWVVSIPSVVRKAMESKTKDSTEKAVASSTKYEFLDPVDVDSFFEIEFYRMYHNQPIVFTLRFEEFSQLLPSQNSIAASNDVAALYYIAFFRCLGIFGIGKSSIKSKPWRSKPMSDIPKIPMSTYMAIGNRATSNYALLWVKQPLEDTSNGWEKATEEAKERASPKFIDSIYKKWIEGEDCNKVDFAILIIIGTKFRVLHREFLSQIPPAANFLNLVAKLKDDKVRLNALYCEEELFELWDEVGISSTDIMTQISWTEIDDMRVTGAVTSCDVLDINDRPRVERGLRFVEAVADQRGKKEMERFA